LARIPIIRLGGVLIATVMEELHDQDALIFQDELMHTLEKTDSQGVLIDLSVVETLDSFLGRLLNDIAVGARLLGARTVVVGIQPAVAVTLVELGLQLKGVRTALDVEKGMALLAQTSRRS
jgi:rsbT antagonist protein RsbS